MRIPDEIFEEEKTIEGNPLNSKDSLSKVEGCITPATTFTSRRDGHQGHDIVFKSMERYLLPYQVSVLTSTTYPLCNGAKGKEELVTIPLYDIVTDSIKVDVLDLAVMIMEILRRHKNNSPEIDHIYKAYSLATDLVEHMKKYD